MEEKKEDIIFIFFLFFSSVIFLFDLFLHQGLPTTFDNPFHTTNLAQFFLALKDFEFPVRWADGFGNYGLPIPIVAHQVTSYIGALILFLVADPELSLKILYFSAIFFSSFFYYVFLRKFFPPLYSFSGAFFYTFSSYKIFNTYVRGALPELFSAIFLPLILLGILLLIKEKSIKGFFLIIGAVALLALNHPMMLFIYAFIYFPFFLWTVFSEGRSEHLSVVASFLQRRVIAFILALGIGILIAGYYIIPLMIETKYFYYGTSDISFTPGNYLTVENFLNSSWPYFTEKDIGTRGHVVTVGILETIVFMIGGVMALLSVKSKSYADKGGILLLAVVNGVGIIFLMLPFAESIFSLIKLLGSVQFQWRFLSAFIFFPPIILSYLLTKLNKQIFAVLVIPLIALVTFPQLYGKNYVLFDREIYFFTPVNVHSVLMNTIWTGKTEEYPIKKEKAEIISGEGEITKRTEENAKREYHISAKTPVRLADYTFYFPGWNVYIDGEKTPIEFQDPNYRGVITYTVPEGEHTIHVILENTKVRLLGNLVTVFGLISLAVLFILKKRIKKHLHLSY